MQDQLNMRVPLDDSKEVSCEKCGHEIFVQGFKIRKISGILTGSSEDTMIPIPVFICNDCGHVNEEFEPIIHKK